MIKAPPTPKGFRDILPELAKKRREVINKIVEDNTPLSEHTPITFQEELPYIITTIISAIFWFGESPVGYIYDYGFFYTFQLMQYSWTDLIRTILWWYLISCIIIYFKRK